MKAAGVTVMFSGTRVRTTLSRTMMVLGSVVIVIFALLCCFTNFDHHISGDWVADFNYTYMGAHETLTAPNLDHHFCMDFNVSYGIAQVGSNQ